jgi:hypothetical protein
MCAKKNNCELNRMILNKRLERKENDIYIYFFFHFKVQYKNIILFIVYSLIKIDIFGVCKTTSKKINITNIIINNKILK